MPADPDPQGEGWQIFYGDIRLGTIAKLNLSEAYLILPKGVWCAFIVR
jgi:hypothetical protein